MTVRCDGEEWPLDFGPELKMIDVLNVAAFGSNVFTLWNSTTDFIRQIVKIF